MMEFLTTEIPDTLAGAMVIVVTAILFIWGLALVVDGRASDPIVHTRPFWHPRRWFVPGFPFSLGWFMLMQGALDGVLGILILKSPGAILVWMFLLVTAMALTAIAAFVWWARDRIPGIET